MESNNNLIEYGKAPKHLWEFTEDDLKKATDEIYHKVRKRAWAGGSPVYYKIGKLFIAEYENGKKMVVESINGNRWKPENMMNKEIKNCLDQNKSFGIENNLHQKARKKLL